VTSGNQFFDLPLNRAYPSAVNKSTTRVFCPVGKTISFSHIG
jgi:hypothetical protein